MVCAGGAGSRGSRHWVWTSSFGEASWTYKPRGSTAGEDAGRRAFSGLEVGSLWRPGEYCAAGRIGIVNKGGGGAVPVLLVPGSSALLGLLGTGDQAGVREVEIWLPTHLLS